MFEPEMDAARRRMGLMAISTQRWPAGSSQYQPLVDFGWLHAGGRGRGAAALAPSHARLRSPAEFIPLAEEKRPHRRDRAGARARLRDRVRMAVAWVAVNLSAIQFASPTFTDELCVVLEESGLPPHRLELEITESLLIHDQKAAVATLDRLHAMGVRVALDDIVPGYSSPAHLKRFPSRCPKIDGAFVRSLDDDGASAVVRAIVDLARALRMGVTAEGIETPQQFRRCAISMHGRAGLLLRTADGARRPAFPIAGGPVLVGRHSAA
ncbi:MAG: EAL domain-containing protein [Vicinamibacterales bacterium]